MLRKIIVLTVALSAALAVSPGASLAQTTLTTTRVASGLNRPLYVTHAPGDFNRVFIVQQTGEIMILDLQGGGVIATPFLDLSGIVSSGSTRWGTPIRTSQAVPAFELERISTRRATRASIR